MQNNNFNNPFNPGQPLQVLSEGLEYKDLEGMMKSTIHVDEFSSKMGDDEDIIVLSFFVRSKQAARDLMNWFEKGYDFVLDSDISPGEIKPNRYLVYLEIRRRTAVPRQISTMLDDLSTLTEFDPSDWTIHANDQTQHWDEETFAKMVPLTPDEYRRRNETDLNEIREAAGLPPKKIFTVKADTEALQSAAGIK